VVASDDVMTCECSGPYVLYCVRSTCHLLGHEVLGAEGRRRLAAALVAQVLPRVERHHRQQVVALGARDRCGQLRLSCLCACSGGWVSTVVLGGIASTP